MKEYFKSFKPYYNWNTFNTEMLEWELSEKRMGFKPYYNWNTFNTQLSIKSRVNFLCVVLNLIITGIPSIPLI